MRWYRWFGLCLCGLIVLLWGGSGAVDAQESSIEDVRILYYEDHMLDLWLLNQNLCLESILRLNPDLDLLDLDFGTAIRVPLDEEICYNPSGWGYSADTQRLIFYEDNAWLETPYYAPVTFMPRDPFQYAAELGICRDDLLADNILLHDFPFYAAFTGWATYDIFLPSERNCPPETVAQNPASTNQPAPAIPSYTESFMDFAAQEYGVCLVDIVEANRLLTATPSGVLIIPERHPCPKDTRAHTTRTTSVQALSYETNLCVSVLEGLNPDLETRLRHGAYNQPRWVLVPVNGEPCYRDFTASTEMSVYVLERLLNVCVEMMVDRENRLPRVSVQSGATIRVPIRALPCYNDQDERLFFPQHAVGLAQLLNSDPLAQPNQPLGYTDVQRHIVTSEDTLYTLSRQYNVCVDALLRANPLHSFYLPNETVLLIPNTRPCYDERTGKQLVYADDEGNLMSQPGRRDQLMHFSHVSIGAMSIYYDVCNNRIQDANAAKFTGRFSYQGTIIPTDRPSCYGAKGYACYAVPVDFSVDPTTVTNAPDFDVDGTHCYDIYAPETLVWYEDTPYKAVDFSRHDLLRSRSFTAWCYGVSLDAINTINDEQAVLDMLPNSSRLIPLPTRPCYLDEPEIFETAYAAYQVQYNDTLTTIANRFGTTREHLISINQLPDADTLWAGQWLVIPAPDAIPVLMIELGILAAGAVMLGVWIARPRL